MRKEGDKTQIFTTALAYSLPILQFFFGQFNPAVQSLFLFQSYFLVVSIFTAITSYVMITVLKARKWFEVSPFQVLRKRKWQIWSIYTNPSVYTNDEIKTYQVTSRPPHPVRTIRPDNIIQVLFLPALAIGFVVFLALGLMYSPGDGEVFVIDGAMGVFVTLAQAIAYACFIVFSVLSFAHQYIRDANAKAYDIEVSNKYEKAIELARKRDAFKERKRVSPVTQLALNPSDPNSLMSFILNVDEAVYALVTDPGIDTIVIAKEFQDVAKAEEFIWGKQIRGDDKP